MDEKETKNGITAVLPAAGISAPEPPSAPAAETPPESLPESPVLPAPADAPAPGIRPLLRRRLPGARLHRRSPRRNLRICAHRIPMPIPSRT